MLQLIPGLLNLPPSRIPMTIVPLYGSSAGRYKEFAVCSGCIEMFLGTVMFHWQEVGVGYSSILMYTSRDLHVHIIWTGH